jgi:hypothetical protein
VTSPLDNRQPQLTGTPFNGIDETCATCGNVPPDVTLGVGPNHILEMVNNGGEVFDKQGNIVKASFSLSGFFSTGGDKISDPKVLFDLLSGRWFASVGCCLDNTGNYVKIAVSDSNDPTGTWHIYQLFAQCPSTNTCNPDQPIIGVSADKLMVSVNRFYNPTNAQPSVGAQYWALNKRQMTEGLTAIDQQSFGPFDNVIISVHPAQSLSFTNDLYMVAAGLTPAGLATNVVNEFRVTGLPPAINVVTTQLAMGAVALPPNAQQPGTSSTLFTGDTRILSAAWSGGNLWFALNDGCTPAGDNQQRSCIRIGQINTNAVAMVQNFDYSANGQFFFYPALTIDRSGNLALVYGYSDGSTRYPSLAVTEQAATDPANTLEAAQTLVAGSGIDNSNHYGDYFEAALDPSDTEVVWVAGEYHVGSSGTCKTPLGTFNCWSTFIGSMFTTVFFNGASPSSLTIVPGATATSTIILSSINAYAGPISLSSQTTISINVVSVDDSNSENFGLLVDQTLGSQFWVTQPSSVIGRASGTFSYSTTLSLTTSPPGHFLDFGVSSAPGQWHAQVTVNGLLVADIDTDSSHHVHVLFVVGGITLCCPPITVQPSASVNPTIVTPTASGSGTSTLTITTTSATTPGTYIFTIMSASGNHNSGTTVTVNIADFSVSANPNSATISAGSLATSMITVAPLYGFTGTVTLASTVSPSGLTCTLSPTSVVLGASQTSTLSCSGPVAVYTVTITGTSGAQSHSATVIFSHPLSYVFPGTFSQSGGVSGSQVTAIVGQPVSVSVTLSAAPSQTGALSVEIRRDIVVYPDSIYVWLNQTVTVGSSTTINAGSFTPSDYTGSCIGCVRQYFFRVWWNNQLVYDPTDPSTRESVQTVGPDFGISSSKSSLSIPVGSSDSSTVISVFSRGGFLRIGITGIRSFSGGYRRPNIFPKPNQHIVILSEYPGGIVHPEDLYRIHGLRELHCNSDGDQRRFDSLGLYNC